MEKLIERYGEEVKNYLNSSENFAEVKIQLYSYYNYRKYEKYHIEGYWEEIKTEITNIRGKFLKHIEENKEEIINKEAHSITNIENKTMYVLFLPNEPAEIMTIQKKNISHRNIIKWEDEIIEYCWDGKKLNVKHRKI